MRILSWNVRGTGGKGFHSQVRYLISEHNRDILVLWKLRLIQRAPKIIDKINLPNFLEISSEGFSRGIWLL